MDLVVDVLVLVERKCPTQAHVHDDADGPHVERAVVTLVQENLRCQVGRGADHGAAEGLFTNDAGKAKVTEFHLEATEIFEVFYSCLYETQ